MGIPLMFSRGAILRAVFAPPQPECFGPRITHDHFDIPHPTPPNTNPLRTIRPKETPGVWWLHGKLLAKSLQTGCK